MPAVPRDPGEGELTMTMRRRDLLSSFASLVPVLAVTPLGAFVSACTREKDGTPAGSTTATPPSLTNASPANAANATASAPAAPGNAAAAAPEDVWQGDKVQLSDDQWRARLSPEAYDVLRKEGTERAFSGNLVDVHQSGTFRCAGCGLLLFKSDTKFESGTGWPSFYQAVNAKNVQEITDNSWGMARTEVRCPRCGGHLGHVFDDGPRPTGLRYCMNSAALTFTPDK